MKTEITQEELELFMELPEDLQNKDNEVTTEAETQKDNTPKEEVKTDDEPAQKEEDDSYINPSRLIELGLIPNILVEIEGQEINLSDMSNISKEVLSEVVKKYNEEVEKERKEKYISKETLTEEQLNIIKILKTKGDLTEVFKTPEELKQPWEGFDNSNEEHNSHALNYHYIVEKGLGEEEAKALIEVAKKNFTLDALAKSVVERNILEYKQKIKAQAEDLEKEEKEYKENVKTYSKTLEETYSSMNLPKEVSSNAVKIATTLGSSGDLIIDEKFQEALKNPKTAADIILFLTNRELYDSRIKEEGKRNAHMDSALRIKVAKANPAGSSMKENEPSDNTNPRYYELK